MKQKPKDNQPHPFKTIPAGRQLKPVVGNDCEHQKLTKDGVDYCLKNDRWLCRALVESGRCPK